jgi:hypothetical protein
VLTMSRYLNMDSNVHMDNVSTYEAVAKLK